ncbi:FHA domain-containing protein [Actinomyces marmotae]|uniref:FHA domain-containing protein n=1 Tax=Actinomyces marmotae TaxID=2737173 RepID=UPI0013598796|nr:FHA domain-containing protein [Actinomyces marmotae]
MREAAGTIGEARWGAGDWHGIITPRAALILPPVIPMPIVERLWRDLHGDGLTTAAVLWDVISSVVARTGERPDFAFVLLEPDGNRHVAVRGRGIVRTSHGDIASGPTSTWTETIVEPSDTLVLLTPDTGDGIMRPLADGIAPVSVVALPALAEEERPEGASTVHDAASLPRRAEASGPSPAMSRPTADVLAGAPAPVAPPVAPVAPPAAPTPPTAPSAPVGQPETLPEPAVESTLAVPFDPAAILAGIDQQAAPSADGVPETLPEPAVESTLAVPFDPAAILAGIDQQAAPGIDGVPETLPEPAVESTLAVPFDPAAILAGMNQGSTPAEAEGWTASGPAVTAGSVPDPSAGSAPLLPASAASGPAAPSAPIAASAPAAFSAPGAPSAPIAASAPAAFSADLPAQTGPGIAVAPSFAVGPESTGESSLTSPAPLRRGDHDGSTVAELPGDLLEEIRSARSELAELPTPDRSGLVPSHGARVLSAFCANSHPNPTHLVACRVCEAPLEGPVRLAPRPVLGSLILSDGRVLSLGGPIVLGRRPSADRVATFDAGFPTCIKVSSPDRQISRNHLLIDIDEWSVLARDLSNTNGTVLLREGSAPVHLSRVETTILRSGDVLELGEGVTARFEAA